MKWSLFTVNIFIFLSILLGSTPEDEAPTVTAGITFMVPKKEISMVPDMGKWKRSQVGLIFIMKSLIPETSTYFSNQPVLDTGSLKHYTSWCIIVFSTFLLIYRHMPTTSASFSHWMKVWRERSSRVIIKCLRYGHQLLKICFIISVSQQWCITPFTFCNTTQGLAPSQVLAGNLQSFVNGEKHIHIKSWVQHGNLILSCLVII